MQLFKRMATKTKNLKVMQMRPIGENPIVIQTLLNRDEWSEMMKETGRVFVFTLSSWDSESGVAEIELRPGNGVVIVEG